MQRFSIVEKKKRKRISNEVFQSVPSLYLLRGRINPFGPDFWLCNFTDFCTRTWKRSFIGQSSPWPLQGRRSINPSFSLTKVGAGLSIWTKTQLINLRRRHYMKPVTDGWLKLMRSRSDRQNERLIKGLAFDETIHHPPAAFRVRVLNLYQEMSCSHFD